MRYYSQNIEQQMKDAEKKYGKKPTPTYAPPEMGLRCGHEIRMRLVTHEECNKMLDELIKPTMSERITTTYQQIKGYFRK